MGTGSFAGVKRPEAWR